MELTPEQQTKLTSLREIWDEVSDPQPDLGWPDTALVHVKSHETGAEMWLGIQPNGNTNS